MAGIAGSSHHDEQSLMILKRVSIHSVKLQHEEGDNVMSPQSSGLPCLVLSRSAVQRSSFRKA